MTQQQNDAKTGTKADGGKAGGKAGGGRSRSDRIRLLLAGLTAFVALALVAFALLSTTGDGGSSGNFTPNDSGLIPVGDRAPSFDAETVDGGSVSVGGGAPGATMLVFFATWCPHCNNEAPIISELEGEYDGLNVVMVGIDGEDDAGKVRQFVQQYDIESPATYEPSLGRSYEVASYPTTYVLDGGGEVVAAHSGEAPRAAYEGWIEEALG